MRPVVLVVMDGVGVGAGDAFDAVQLANTPTLDRLRTQYPYRTLRAHGTAVGLASDGDMGNSEVGHNILGAGRILPQGARRVEEALADGSIWSNKTWCSLVERCLDGGTLHLIGLLSDGNVHSHTSHLEAILQEAEAAGVPSARVHALFDGRDVPDNSAEKYVARFQSFAQTLKALDVRIASGGGRMTTTMDRYGADWEVVEAGWQAHVSGEARGVPSVDEGLRWARSQDSVGSDQYLPAFTVVGDDGQPVGKVEDGDAVLIFNFRGDRVVELAQAFEVGSAFEHFDRGRVPDVFFAGMTLYDGDLGIPTNYLVQPPKVNGTVSEVICEAGLRQWACAETQKYGHVTYFWNGNRSDRFSESLEEFVEIQSDQVPFWERPWMKSAETADALVAKLREDDFDFLRVNFASGDMVAHSGSLPATRIALEAVDLAIGRIEQAVRRAGGVLVVTGDHGNADDMAERAADGTPMTRADGTVVAKTAHSLNPVPLYFSLPANIHLELDDSLPNAGLANVAATLLDLLEVPIPSSYEPSLIAASERRGQAK